MEKDLRKKLGIDDWLELVKEDRNCNGAYISFGQYMYLLEKENQDLKKQLEDMTLCRDIASGHRKEVQDRETILLNQQKEFIEWLEHKITNCEELEEKLYKKYRVPKYYELGKVRGMIGSLKETLKEYKETIGYKKMKKCKTCEEIEFWRTEKPNPKEFKSKLFVKFSRYTWHKSQIARKGEQISDITSKAFDLNYCPTCGRKISDIKIPK